MNIVEKAIYRNELKELLEGKNEYKLENDSWASISAPIDWTRVIPMLYEIYSKDESIKLLYEETIVQMLQGDAEDFYCGIAVLYFQILRESSGRSPFMIDREKLLLNLKDNIKNNVDGLKNSNMWAGQTSENGLWDEVERYKKLFQSKFGIII